MNLTVKSQSKAGVVYDVSIVDGVASSCTCPAARWYAGLCKHVTAVNTGWETVVYLAWRARHQVDNDKDVAVMRAIYNTVRQGVGYHPEPAHIDRLIRIVANIDETPWGDVEREVLGGLLAGLSAANVVPAMAA